MKRKETISLDYPADAHYNPAVRAGDFIFTCGHTAMEDDKGRELTTVAQQTKWTLKDLKNTLASAGAEMDDIVKATVYITRMEDYEAMNEEYMKFFKGPTPARSTIVAKLVLDEILVEIEAIAYKPTS